LNIAISGAGVAGPALAYWLARCGHAPTLIEKAPRLRTGGYMIDFWGLGFELAERMGLAPAVREAGYRVRCVRYVGGDGRVSGQASTQALTGLLGDRFVSLSRGDLAALLYRRVEGQAETLFGTEIAGIEQGPEAVRMTFDDGSARDFDLVFGADGLHSNVRRLVFADAAGLERPLGYHVAAFECVGYRPRDELTYVSYGLPGRQISRFAQRGDRTLFLFVFESTRLCLTEPSTLEARKAALAQVFEDARWEWPSIREALARTDELYFDVVSQIEAPKWSKGRVALIGDAAACISLLGGEGTGLAMIEAYVLAGELKAAGGDHALAFANYEERLRGFIADKQHSARRFARSFAPHTAFGVWFRDRVVQLMAIPGLARLLIGPQLKDELILPDYGL
jgi:2-polyprenyl-6-methoxyphenol hydroxylase-like FAD-dependent oxidoreductase